MGISLLLAVARCEHSYCGSCPLPVSTCTWWLSLKHFCVLLCVCLWGGGAPQTNAQLTDVAGEVAAVPAPDPVVVCPVTRDSVLPTLLSLLPGPAL